MGHFQVEWSAYAKCEAHSSHWMKKTGVDGTVLGKWQVVPWAGNLHAWCGPPDLLYGFLHYTLWPGRWDFENTINGLPCPPSRGVLSPWEAPSWNWMMKWEWGKTYSSTIGAPTQWKQKVSCCSDSHIRMITLAVKYKLGWKGQE